jgi:hypothetical protein
VAISFINKAQGTSNYLTSVTVSKPTNTADDDVMIAFIGGTRSSAPSGWTLIGSASSGTDSLGTVYVYRKVAASEGSSYTFNFSGGWLACGVIATYRGVDTSDPIGGSTVTAVGEGTGYTSASVTADGTQWAVTGATGYEFGSSSTRTWTEGSGTERADFGVSNTGSPDNTNCSITDSNGVVASGSFTRTQTRSASAAGGVKFAVLLNPDAPSSVNAPAGVATISATVTNGSVWPGRLAPAGNPAATATISNAPVTSTASVYAGVATVNAVTYILAPEAAFSAVAATAYNVTAKIAAGIGVAEVSASTEDVAFTHETTIRVEVISAETRLTMVGLESRTLTIERELSSARIILS